METQGVSGKILYEYPENGDTQGCGPGRVKFVTRPQEGGSGTCLRALRETQRTVDMDGMILLDSSGSVGNADWDLMIEVGVKVVETFGNNVGPNTDHLNLGAVAWSDTVNPGAFGADLSVIKQLMATWKGDPSDSRYSTQLPGRSFGARYRTGGRPFNAGTKFTNPLALCAQKVKYGNESSASSNAFRMCWSLTTIMLIPISAVETVLEALVRAKKCVQNSPYCSSTCRPKKHGTGKDSRHQHCCSLRWVPNRQRLSCQQNRLLPQRLQQCDREYFRHPRGQDWSDLEAVVPVSLMSSKQLELKLVNLANIDQASNEYCVNTARAFPVPSAER